MTYTQEPNIVQGSKPEDTFQKAITEEIKKILEKKSQSLVEYFILPNFGLDVAVFMQWPDCSTARFFELKAFVGSRQGGVGFGNQHGEGLQVDLLLLGSSQLKLADQLIRWMLVDGTRPIGSRRFVIFNNDQAKNSAMGGVSRGKQNNLRVNNLIANAITWDDLSAELESFLTSSETKV